MNYAVATHKGWEPSPDLPGKWHVFVHPSELTVDAIEKIKPRYLFFPHWSRKVPAEILEMTECVLFHMTDLPYGRGGSPLQNLIMEGYTRTKITALRMVEEIDAGPIYMKQDLPLKGSAQEIYDGVAKVISGMMEEIIATNPEPVPQQGKPTYFTRRTPEMSRLPAHLGRNETYDHIRMLDAYGYPRAFMECDGYRLTFRDAKINGSDVVANVRIERA